MSDINELAKALNDFQAEIVTVGKTANNPFFKSKYADLATIMLAAQPILTKHGLAVTQLPTTQSGHPALMTMILHKSGQSIKETIEMTVSKQDPQGVGSAITYYRRYAYAAALQIVIDDDDDGNRAVRAPALPAGQKEVLPATTQQKQAIKRRLDKDGINPDEMTTYLQSKYGVDTPLTKDAAAKVIDRMITGADE